MLGLLVLATSMLVASTASGRTLRVTCHDGNVRCDADGARNRLCSFTFCPKRCRNGVCSYTRCDPTRSDALRIVLKPIFNKRHARGFARLGRDLAIVHCVARPDPPLCLDDLSKRACEAAGGDFGRHGIRQEEFCQCRSGDGGQPCRGAGDCVGLCIAESVSDHEGRCSEHVVEYGCFPVIGNTGEVDEMCFD